jgi:acetyl-CoA carboxylase biotin carboxyl carrier protein
MLSFKEIKELIDLVAEKKLSGVEIERAGFRLRIEGIRADSNGSGPVYYTPMTDPLRVSGAGPAALPAPAEAPAPAAAAEDESLHYIVSPIVGTFYRSASPEAAPFVSPGDRVEESKILCIIEAMKLMNEIDSEFDGEIVNIYVEAGQPVQYGERLFAIRTR